MTQQEQSLMEYNPGVLAVKISDLCHEGWRVDPDRSMTLLGYMWEVWLIRDATDEQVQKDADDLAKPGRAEILAKARAAKAEKAKQAAQEETTE